MKLHQEDPVGKSQIHSFSQGQLLVNQTTYSKSMIISPDQAPIEWRPSCLAELVAEDFKLLLNYVTNTGTGAGLVLLGTGMTHEFISPELYQELLSKRISVECMSTSAACRTYTVLSSELRPVVAALLLV